MSLLKACAVSEHGQPLIHIDDYKQCMKGAIVCPQCSSSLVAKVGFKNTHHYAHKANTRCDAWTEPMTSWHKGWQDLFEPENVEVIMTCNGVKHIADVAFEGHILEIQHSHISAADVQQRESFYTSNGKSLIWIVDGRSEKDCVVLGVTHDNYAAIWASRSWWWHAKNRVLIDTNEGLFRVAQYSDKKVGTAVRVTRMSEYDVTRGLSASGSQDLRCILSSGKSPRLLASSFANDYDGVLASCKIAGDTYPIKATLKRLGMHFNKNEWLVSCIETRGSTTTRHQKLWNMIANSIQKGRRRNIKRFYVQHS